MESLNEVCLAGRLTREPVTRLLPSGDEVVTFAVVVDRPPGSQGVRVDALDCAAWTARTRRTVSTWRVGDVVEVHGALRRRFFRASGTPSSRVEVEVVRAKRLHRGTAA